MCASRAQADGQDVLAGTLRDISYHGDTFKLDVAVGDDLLTVKVAREHGTTMTPGQEVFLSWKPTAVRVLPAADGDGHDKAHGLAGPGLGDRRVGQGRRGYGG